MTEFFFLALLVALGLASHLLAKFRELRKTELTLTLRNYISGHPYQLLSSMLAATTVAILFYNMGELTTMNAIGVGYIADSALDKIGDRTRQSLR